MEDRRPSDGVAAAIRGDPGAVDRLVDAWLGTVMGWCYRLAGPRVDPEDAAHDAIVLALTRLHTLRDPERFAGWLFRVVRSVVAQHRRRAWLRGWMPGRVPDQPDPGPGPGAETERREIGRRVQLALESLPAEAREVVVLLDLEERSVAEVAELLGTTASRVETRHRAGRERFRRAALRLGLDPVLLER